LEYIINRSAINLLKIKFDESLNWEPQVISPNIMKVIPVKFNSEHKQMLGYLQVLISKGYVAVPEKFEKIDYQFKDCIR
jgi:hypothetical protein